ncbi:MAG: hypothetical protein FWE05_06375 [Defluviitaleaceae bacterium]|nr:hypothetical protein [Defluviitaleaceae bacterium]
MKKQKYIPLEKQSKRAQKEFHTSQRRDWGPFSPVTRKVPNNKVYNRKKSEQWQSYEPPFGFFVYI